MLNKILYGATMLGLLILIVLGSFAFENVSLFLYELLLLTIIGTVTQLYAKMLYD